MLGLTLFYDSYALFTTEFHLCTGTYIRYQSDSRLSFTLAVCLAEKTILLLQAAKQIRNKIRIFQQNIGIKETLILVTKKGLFKKPL